MPIDNLFNTELDIESFFQEEEDTNVPKNSEASNARQSGLAALVDNEIDDTPLELGYQTRRVQAQDDPSYETIRSDIAKKATSEAKDDVDNLISEFFNDGKTEDAVTGLEVAEETKQDLDIKSETSSIEETFVSTKSYTIDEKRRDQAQFKLEAARDVLSILDEQDLTDKIINFSGFLLSDMTLDLSRVVDSDYLGTPDSVVNFLNTWEGLDVSAKRRLYPSLKAAIHEATDENNIKTAINLMRFIDPESAEAIKSELLIDQVLLGFDIATFGASILTRLAKLAKGSNIIKAAKTVDREDDAAKLNVAALIDETGEAVDATKTTPEVATSNASAFKMEDIMPEATDGINVESQRILSQVEVGRSETMARLTELVDGEAFIKETAFTRTQKERVQAKALQEIETLKDEVYSSQGWEISDIKVAKSNEKGFTLEYLYEGVPSKKVYNYDFKLSDIGTFDQLKTGAVEKLVESPSIYLKGVQERFVEGATNIELGSAKVLDIFNRTVDDIMSSTIGRPVLHKQAYQELDSVLLTGDDFLNVDGTSGKLYKVDELLTGVDTHKGTVRLDEKQAVAYYRLRDLFDTMGVLKNNELRNTLKLNGMKDISFEGTKAIGKSFERMTDGLNSLSKRKNNVIYNPLAREGEGGVSHLSDIDMEDMYANNFRIVRFQENEVAGNQHITHALVKLEDINKLPAQVMHIKKGYVPKIYKEGFYFVKKELAGTLNGQAGKVVGLKTLRMFDSKKGADKFMKQLQAEEPATKFLLLHDREMTQTKLADEGMGISGGLYTSARSKHPILFNEEGLTPQRLSAFESLQRNLQHLSNYLPRNEWRIGMQQKWINTAREQRMLDGTDFNAALIGEKHTPEWNALNSAREYIKDQMRIPTSEERWFEAKVRSIAEWAENPIELGATQIASQRLPEFARKSLQTFAHTDPFALARSTAFHSLLGWFNPAQLFVQAQGASIAVSLYPEHGVQAFHRYMSLRPLMHLTKDNTNLATAKKMSDKIAKSTKIDPDELWEDYTTWRKSGLQESIKATADHAASAQNFGFGMQAVRDVADKGLVFYREGEMLTRGIAFTIAKSVWRKANKGKKIGHEDLKDILDHSMQMQLNLTRANRAAWQKGALSVPTQFLQIQTKFVEQIWPTVLGGKGTLTGGQKAKLMAMQLAIYGAAGVPFGNWLMNEAMQTTGKSPEEFSVAARTYYRGGMWDYLFYQSFGADVELGKRGAIVSGIEGLFKSLIYDRAPFTETLFGAFGAVGTRSMQAMKELAPLAADPSKMDYTVEEFTLAARSIAKIVSTGRNIDTAIMISRQGLVYDKRGNKISAKDFNTAELIMKGLGFQLGSITNVYNLSQQNRVWDEHLDERASWILGAQNWYLDNIDHATAGRNFEVMQQGLLGDLNHYDQTLVLQKVQKRVNNNKTKHERALTDYYKNRADTVVELNPYFGGDYTNTIIPEQGVDE